MAYPSQFSLVNPLLSYSPPQQFFIHHTNHLNPPKPITSTPSPVSHLSKTAKSTALRALDKIPQRESKPTSKLNHTAVATNKLLEPLRLSLIHALTRYTNERNVNLGENYHVLAIKMGFIHDKYVATSLVSMYAKCGDVESAYELFGQSPDLDSISYNSLISGYASNGLFDRALKFFIQAQSVEIVPTEHTFTTVIGVCGNASGVIEGKQLHGQVLKRQYLSYTSVGNALMTMYSKFGMVRDAEVMFEEIQGKNHISWTAIITAFYKHDCFEKALGKFYLMGQNGIEPDEYSFGVTFAACGGMGVPRYGRMVHAQAIKNGLLSSVYVGTAILDMYAEHGEMGDAERQLEDMGTVASVVSWNTVVAGYVRNRKSQEAIEAFCQMERSGIKCDEFTYSNVLKACSSIPLLSTGEQIHCQVIKNEYRSSMHVGSALMELYTNCGKLADAEYIFNQMPALDVVLWNSMIKGYAQYGYPEKAMLLFQRMIEEGTRPTGATFLAVFSACSHSGLVKEGMEYLESMVRDYGITVKETHYSCIVDMLGRAGQLADAIDFITKLPIKPTASVWRPLLAASRCHNNLQIAEFVAERILQTDPGDPTVYVTLSNMYAKVWRWDDVEKQRKFMTFKDVKKEPGCSWIEVKNKLYQFYSSDTRHAESPKIYAKLEELVGEMKNMGYVPDTDLAINPNKEGSKEQQVLHHSEKLAVCFGLINLPPSSKPIRIFKNLRVCDDCHSAMKYMSRVTDRDIVLRDNYRFHYFKQGRCSCGDYW